VTSSGPSLTAEQALSRLKRGNQRFLAGKARFPTVQKEVLANMARAQRPYATVLGCSDSRVPPELLFDAGFGELFIIRIAGNVLGPNIAGTLQYASAHLHTPLFVVMGHDGCGAVEAAIASKWRGVRQRSRIQKLLENIIPALDGLDGKLPHDTLMKLAVEANVRWTLKALRRSPEGGAKLATGTVRLIGAVYEIATGRVRFLED